MKKFILLSLMLIFSASLMIAQKTFINTSIDLDARNGMSMVTLFATDDNNQELTELNYCFIWNTGDTSSQITIPMPLEETLYSVTITSTDGTVEVLEISSSCFLNLAVMPNITCSGQKATLMVTDPNGIPLQIGNGYNYFWSDDPNIHTPGREVSPLTTTSYTVTVTYNPDGGPIECSNSMTRTVNVMPSPFIAWQQIPGAICSGQTLLMQVLDNAGNVLPNGGGWQYAWSTGHTVSSFTISPTSTATYSVTVTSPDGCVQEMQPRVVLVNPAPVIPIITQDDLMNGGAILTINGIGNWSTGATNTGHIFVSSPGFYSVTVTNEFGCTSVDTIFVPGFQECEAEVIIVEVPHDTCLSGGGCTLTVEIIPQGNTKICKGDELLLTSNTNAIGPVLYNWSNGKVTKNITVTTAGDYMVTVTDQDGCTDVASIWIDEIQEPKVTITSSRSYVCPGNTGVAIDVAWNGGDEVAHISMQPGGGKCNLGEQGTPLEGLCEHYVLYIQETTNFIVTVLGKNGCSVVDTIRVFYNPDDCDGITDSEDEEMEKGKLVNISPNPVLREGSVQVTGLSQENYQAEILDMLGKVQVKRYDQTFVGENFQVPIGDLPAGVYTLLLTEEKNGKRYPLRLVVVG